MAKLQLIKTYQTMVEIEVPDSDVEALGGTLEERDEALDRILGQADKEFSSELEYVAATLQDEDGRELWDDN